MEKEIYKIPSASPDCKAEKEVSSAGEHSTEALQPSASGYQSPEPPTLASPTQHHIETPSPNLGNKMAVLTVVMAAISLGAATTLTRITGIMYVEMQREFNATKMEASFISPIFFGCYNLFGLLAVVLLNKFGYFPTIFIGFLMIIGGLFSSAFVNSHKLFYITYGFIPGTGFTLVNHSVMTLTGTAFNRRRPMVYSILQTAPFVMMMPLIVQYLIDTYGLRMALLVLAGIMGIGGISGLILSQLPKSYPDDVRNNVIAPQNIRTFNWQLFKDKTFVCYMMFFALHTTDRALFSFYVFDFANSLGVKSFDVTVLLSILTVLIVVLRLVTGCLYSQRKVCGVKVNCLTILTIAVVLRFFFCLLVTLVATNYITFCVTFMLVAFVTSIIGSLPDAVLAYLFGGARLNSSLGVKKLYVLCFNITSQFAVGGIINSLSGRFAPATLSRIPYVISTIYSFLSFVFLMLGWKNSRHRESYEDIDDDDVSDDVVSNGVDRLMI